MPKVIGSTAPTPRISGAGLFPGATTYPGAATFPGKSVALQESAQAITATAESVNTITASGT